MKISANVLKNKFLKKGSVIDHLLVSLFDDTVSEKVEFRQKMNVSIVIDVSGSMDNVVKSKEQEEYLIRLAERNQKIRDFYNKNKPVDINIHIHNHNNPYIDPWVHGHGFGDIFNKGIHKYPDLPYELTTVIEAPQTKTKLMLAKEAARRAVESLHEGDMLSIVKFSSVASVVVPNTVITRSNKEDILRKINELKTEGATNLYDGWYFGAKQVADNIKENQVNRVVVLTDGEATHGYRTSEEFCPRVADIFDAGISTSTIGFGDSFNEEVLESISIAGNGNFYYGKVDEDLGAIFDLEFNDMKNTVAQKIEIAFELADGVSIKNESAVTRELSRNVYALPNLKIGSPRNSVFTVSLDSNVTKELATDKLLGNIVVSYTDKDGKEQKEKVSLKFDVVTDDIYTQAPDNKEVKVQKALIEIAEQQKKAMEELAKGHKDSARNLMAGAVSLSASYGIVDDRLASSSTVMLNSMRSLDSGDSLEAVKKSVHYGKYKTERGDTK